MNKIGLIILVTILHISNFVLSQQKEIPTKLKQPKIGLVLSGGGAKGFAHIGVLKVLEENGIHPDYISGTSMGALVGALYSLGYSAHQLDSIASYADWNDLLSDKINLKSIPIFKKEDYPGFPFKMHFSNNYKPELPSGMISGQKVEALFSKLVWTSFNYSNFDEFPIPFRCVATDVISGCEYVFKDGNLAVAMRSSMAIPTVFTPVVIDSMILIDGGVVKNFPIDECLAMNADIIIGVNTGFLEDPKREDLQSMIKILARSAASQNIRNTKLLFNKADLLIVPDLKEYGAESFNLTQKIIDIGEQAARDSIVICEIKKIASLKKSDFKKKPLINNSKVWVEKVSVIGNCIIDSLTILNISHLQNNSHLSAEDVDEAIKLIYSTQLFEKVTYNINPRAKTLTFLVTEKSRGNIRMGIHYDNSFGPDLLLKSTYSDWLLKNSMAGFKFSLSVNPQLSMSYKYYPTKRRKLELSLNSYFQLTKMPDIISEDSVSFAFGHYLHSQADFNFRLSWSPFNNTMLQFSSGRQFNVIDLKEAMEVYYEKDRAKYHVNYASVRLLINSLNDPFFPKKGGILDVNYKYTFNARSDNSDTLFLFGDLSDFNSIFTFSYEQYFLIKNRFSIIPKINFGIMSENSFITEKFSLGGLNYNLRPNAHNFPGIRSNYLATNNFLNVGLEFQYNLFDNLYFQLGANSLFFGDNSEIDAEDPTDEFDDNTFSSWKIGVGYYSKIGPLRFIISKSPEREEFVWNLNLGFPF
jgi:NTE family protein